MTDTRTYIAIDLKSFYASVECHERGLNPLTTNLVVADESRTEKTICLAVSPSLKACGIPGRPRLFEVVQRVKAVNRERQMRLPSHRFTGESSDAEMLARDPSLKLSYIVAKPRMAYYMNYSTRIYGIYLQYVAPADIQAYSIDEVFIDATSYLKTRHQSAHDFTRTIIRHILTETGITATAGIGTNLYLAKIAMDIVAKHMPADKDGVRIAALDERSYRETLWTHEPLTDFWRVGRGYAKKLAEHGMRTMGDIARCSIGPAQSAMNEELLYKLFGVNAELLIDHAWGWEPCTISDIKAYKPTGPVSLSSGQVLSRPYPARQARIVAREMVDGLVLALVRKRLAADQLVLTVCYDAENCKNPAIRQIYKGPFDTDRYGRRVPKDAHGSENLGAPTSSGRAWIDACMKLFDRIVNPNLLIRRMYVVANRLVREEDIPKATPPVELDLFADTEAENAAAVKKERDVKRERSVQEALLAIKAKYGKNAVLKAASLQEGATARERNREIGGHRA